MQAAILDHMRVGLYPKLLMNGCPPVLICCDLHLAADLGMPHLAAEMPQTELGMLHGTDLGWEEAEAIF